jgi:hypothetical protein
MALRWHHHEQAMIICPSITELDTKEAHGRAEVTRFVSECLLTCHTRKAIEE